MLENRDELILIALFGFLGQNTERKRMKIEKTPLLN